MLQAFLEKVLESVESQMDALERLLQQYQIDVRIFKIFSRIFIKKLNIKKYLKIFNYLLFIFII